MYCIEIGCETNLSAANIRHENYDVNGENFDIESSFQLLVQYICEEHYLCSDIKTISFLDVLVYRDS